MKTHTIPQRILKNQSLEQFKRKKQFIDSIKTTVVVLETAPKEEKKISEQEKSPSFEKKEETVKETSSVKRIMTQEEIEDVLKQWKENTVYFKDVPKGHNYKNKKNRTY